MTPPRGKVVIVGAGPGDPGLLTARGVRVLAEADVVVYDRAVESVLRWARPDAERIEAGAPAERETAQDALSMLLAEKAREGLLVVRLKWGDPFVFDSGAKEALFLHEQGVPFDVVPGVPAAIAGPAYAGIPVTYPGAADALLLLRGQEDNASELPQVDWSAVAHLDGTIVCYAGTRLANAILQKLIVNGLPAETPAALVDRATMATQVTTTGTVQSLLEATADTPSVEGTLLVVGDVTSLRDHLRWFDIRPLFGRRIVVTRSAEQAGALIDQLENLGAQVIQAPTFRVESPDDPEAIDRAASSIGDYDWIVFESANAVNRLVSAVMRGPRDVRAFGGVCVGAVGPSTADRLLAAGIKPDVAAPEFGEPIGDAMAAHGLRSGQRVLVVRPDHLRGVIGEDLEKRGVIVTDLVAYRTAPAAADSPAAQELYRLLLEGRIDAVTFTSPTAVRRFAALVGEEEAADLLNTTVVATIGPVTAAAASEMGVAAPLFPSSYTIEGMVAVLVEQFRSK